MNRIILATAVTLILTACASAPKPTAKPQTQSLDAVLTLMMTGEGRDASALKTQIKTAQAHPLGSEKNPIRAWHPQGERAYLSRLKCPDGSAPTYDRDGSFGAGPYGTILDRYTVKCSGHDGLTAKVYMDMYHKNHEENQAVDGFTID